ncbi:MAG: hypothetical protein HBSAPP03_04010 [Phycisphaerae bacterium]|nr:MAG: hypothetical protein HBSAPP03_04010 [Phycisphaerae bacterium]
MTKEPSGTRPAMTRQYAMRAAVAALAACAAWALLVRPLERRASAEQARLATSLRELEQIESNAESVADLAPAIESMRGQLGDLYAWASISGDTGRLYESLRRLATASGVRLERIEPAAARQAVRAGARQPHEVAVETAGYTVDITGTYAAIAEFVHACEHQLGATRLGALRVSATAPSPSGQASILSATIETIHVRLAPPSPGERDTTPKRRDR